MCVFAFFVKNERFEVSGVEGRVLEELIFSFELEVDVVTAFFGRLQFEVW